MEAADAQERKETEDLLAGFDRPGRSPRPPSAERDFVDYFAKKKDERGSGSGRASASAGAGIAGGHASSEGGGTGADGDGAGAPMFGPAGSREEATVIVPGRRRRRDGAVLAWLAIALVMLSIGAGIALLATKDDGGGHARAGVTGPAASAGAVTTITSGSHLQAPGGPSARDDIPPPPPSAEADAIAEAAAAAANGANQAASASAGQPQAGQPSGSPPGPPGAARASGKAGPRSQRAGEVASDPAASSKAPPRDDFLRDF